MIAVSEFTLPASWASALVNGDVSGLEDSEAAQIDAWLESENPGYCVGCSDESHFSWGNAANNLGGDCLVYTFHSV